MEISVRGIWASDFWNTLNANGRVWIHCSLGLHAGLGLSEGAEWPKTLAECIRFIGGVEISSHYAEGESMSCRAATSVHSRDTLQSIVGMRAMLLLLKRIRWSSSHSDRRNEPPPYLEISPVRK